MVRIGKTQLAAMVLLCFTLMAGQSQAEWYKFSGYLPSYEPDGDWFTLRTEDTDFVLDGGAVGVSPGDYWELRADVDLGAPGSDQEDLTGVKYYYYSIITGGTHV